MALPDGSKAVPGPRRWSDYDIELLLGTLLRAGVLTAAAVVLAGGVLYLIKYGRVPPRYSEFAGEPEDLRDVPGILRAAAALRPRGLIQLGLLLLIATPVARVAFSLIAFLRQGDRLYTAITLFVLTLLVLSLAGVGP
jgi:uncharacterized membrane protein